MYKTFCHLKTSPPKFLIYTQTKDRLHSRVETGKSLGIADSVKTDEKSCKYSTRSEHEKRTFVFLFCALKDECDSLGHVLHLKHAL